MKTVYLHLALSHIPVIGILFTLIIMIAGGVLKKRDLKTAALTGIMLIAITVVAVYYSGEYAEGSVEHLPWAAEQYIGIHEEWATASVISSGVLGVAALAGLMMMVKSKNLPGRLLWGILICTIITAGLLARTANTGGQVRHAEIRPDFQLTGSYNDAESSGHNKHRKPNRYHHD